MSDRSRVVWHEGLFLRPQHFQQQERYLERYIEARAGAPHRHRWGVLDLELDRELLLIGKVALRRAHGSFADGTPFAMPDEDPLPPPLEIAAATRDRIVYLAVPIRRAGALEMRRDRTAGAAVRFEIQQWEARDVTRESSDRIAVEVSTLRALLVLEESPIEDFACIPIARVRECRSDRQIILDDNFMPTALDINAVEPLARYMTELLGMLKQHGDSLGQLLVGVRSGGVADVGNLIQLQVLNRYEPMLVHLSRSRPVHPDELYLVLAALAGELAIFEERDRRPPALPEYQHHDLQRSFEPLMKLLRRYLAHGPDLQVRSLEVEVGRQQARYLVRVPDPTLFEFATFFIAVHADFPREKIAEAFPEIAILAPGAQLEDYVTGMKPCFELKPVQVLPPQLPWFAEYAYFQIERHHPAWSGLRADGAFGIYISSAKLIRGGLQMKMWALRAA